MRKGHEKNKELYEHKPPQPCSSRFLPSHSKDLEKSISLPCACCLGYTQEFCCDSKKKSVWKTCVDGTLSPLLASFEGSWPPYCLCPTSSLLMLPPSASPIFPFLSLHILVGRIQQFGDIICLNLHDLTVFIYRQWPVLIVLLKVVQGKPPSRIGFPRVNLNPTDEPSLPRFLPLHNSAITWVIRHGGRTDRLKTKMWVEGKVEGDITLPSLITAVIL